MKIKAFSLSLILGAVTGFYTTQLNRVRRPHSYPRLFATSSYNNPSSATYLHEISSTHIDSAIDILEEQHYKQDVPIDSILRKYIKQYNHELQFDSDEKELVREVVLGVARYQYRIDYKLGEIGIECTPENRVLAYITAKQHEDRDTIYNEQVVRKLIKSNKWLHKLKGIKLDEDDTISDLQTRLECPEWAWPGLNEAYPSTDELSLQLKGLLQPPPLDLRVNTLKCKREEALQSIQNAGLDSYETPWSPLGIRLDNRVPLGMIPGLLEGEVEPQDEGSQLVAALLDARPGETVADYCSGTGGKTLAIAAQMKNKGRLYSLDVNEDRLERGRPRCIKAGVDNVQRQTVQADMTRKDKWCKKRKRTFDRVFIDAPCSGVGSWRRKPDARRTWGIGEKGISRLKELLPLQQHILRRAARLVKPGGRLVYVTCSLLPEENEHQIEAFLQFDEGEANGWRIDAPADFYIPFEAGEGRYLRLTPANHNTDGFFACVMIRDKV